MYILRRQMLLKIHQVVIGSYDPDVLRNPGAFSNVDVSVTPCLEEIALALKVVDIVRVKVYIFIVSHNYMRRTRPRHARVVSLAQGIYAYPAPARRSYAPAVTLEPFPIIVFPLIEYGAEYMPPIRNTKPA